MNKIIIKENFEEINKKYINFFLKNNKWIDMKISLLIYDIIKKDIIKYFKNSIKFIIEGTDGNNKNIKGYGSILKGGPLFILIAKKFNLNKGDFYLGRHLYISEEYRGQGLAKKIKESQIEYAKKNNKKFIIGFTSSQKNLETYKKYGAEEIGKVGNIYFYKYKIN